MFTPLGSPKRDDFINFPIKIQSRSVDSNYCVICGIYLKKNDSFYSLIKDGLLATLNEILGANILLPSGRNDRRRVCKSCFRRSEIIVCKRKVLEREFRGKYASVSRASSTKRLAKDSPHVRKSKKIRPEINKEIHARRLFSNK